MTTEQVIEESEQWTGNDKDSSVLESNPANSRYCKTCNKTKPLADFASAKTGKTILTCAECKAPAARVTRDTSGTKRKIPYSQKVIDNAATKTKLVESRTTKKRRTIEAKAQKEAGSKAQAEIQKTFGKRGK
jgi:hypothetical protein